METLLKILAHPFTWGLAIGFVFAAWAFFAGWSARRGLRRDIRRLETVNEKLAATFQTQSEILAKANRDLQGEIAVLKESNGNLKVSLDALKNKPERAELQKLYLLDKAVHLMYERAPGFAPAWEGALREAQAELDKTSSGLLPWIRRIVHPSSVLPGPAPSAALPPPDGAKPDA